MPQWRHGSAGSLMGVDRLEQPEPPTPLLIPEAAARAIRAARARDAPDIQAVIEMCNAAFSLGHDSAPSELSRCDKQGITLDFQTLLVLRSALVPHRVGNSRGLPRVTTSQLLTLRGTVQKITTRLIVRRWGRAPGLIPPKSVGTAYPVTTTGVLGQPPVTSRD
jgi:hypothetical protein